jgi:ADP-heptose:LPS heptosyltransferase
MGISVLVMSRINNIIRRVVLVVIAAFAKLFVHKNKSIHYLKVLILRLDAIGDAILWLDSAKEYRTLFPSDQYELTLLCSDIWSSIARELPYFDNVISLNKKLFYNGLSYNFKFLKEIRNAGYDIVINPLYSRDFIFQDTIVWVSGAARRIGFAGDVSNIRGLERKLSDKWYTELISSRETNLMELERNAEFIRKLGFGNFRAGMPQLPEIQVSFKLPDTEYFVLFPGASSQGKMWPLANFIEIAKRIHGHTEWIGAICGGIAEKELGEQIIMNCPDMGLVNFCGETSLIELAEVIRKARILVSNDTSAIHFAAAVATPSVCILGGGHFGRFLPYTVDSADKFTALPKGVFCKMECFNCNWVCKYEIDKDGHYPCISAVSVDQVWACVKDIICC